MNDDAKPVQASNLKETAKPVLRCLLNDAKLDDFDDLGGYIEQGESISPSVDFGEDDRGTSEPPEHRLVMIICVGVEIARICHSAEGNQSILRSHCTKARVGLEAASPFPQSGAGLILDECVGGIRHSTQIGQRLGEEVRSARVWG